MTIGAKILLTAVVIATTISVRPIHAEDRNDLMSGEIQIEETSETKRSPKVVNQEEAAEWLDGMAHFTEGGGVGSAPEVSNGAAQHLALMYLYCNFKKGVCPFVLDSILASDIARAKTSGVAECPSMSLFWKAWIANDLEQRAKYLLSIGSATAVANFNSVERPKYIKCKETVADALKDGGAGLYGQTGSATAAVATTARLATDIKERQIDLYSTLGVTVGSDGKPKGKSPVKGKK